MSFKGYAVSVTGASHEELGEGCQDSARVYLSDSFCVAAVADGHGSAKHFRSAAGSEMATRVAIRSVCDFYERNGDLSVFFRNDPRTAARKIAANIICGWNDEIAAHIKLLPLDDREQRISRTYEGLSTELIYGATLLLAIVTEEDYFGLQIGDGCFTATVSGYPMIPMPEDERLVGNLTTSLCDSDAISGFRYVYREERCDAVTLSSDGLINSFLSAEDFLKFTRRITEAIKSDSTSALSEHLSIRSQQGSRDDISVAALLVEREND